MGANTYTRVGDFTDAESANAGGRSTVSTAVLDGELDAVRTALNAHATDIDVMLRDDNLVRDELLKGHEFSATALSYLSTALSLGSVVWRGAWVAATQYAVNDVVSVTGNGSFVCVTAHLSAGAFSATNWVKLAADGAPGTISPAVYHSNGALAIDATYNFATVGCDGATITLPPLATVSAGWQVTLISYGSSNSSVDGYLAEPVYGVASGYAPVVIAVPLLPGASITLQVGHDGAYWSAINKSPFGAMTVQDFREGIEVLRDQFTGPGQIILSDSSLEGSTVLSAGTLGYKLTANGAADVSWEKWKTCLHGDTGKDANIVAFGATKYSGFLGGNINSASLDASVKSICPVSGTLSAFRFRFGTNTIDGTVVATLLLNGTPTAMSVSVLTGGKTSIYAYTATEIAVSAGDELTIKLVAGGTVGSAGHASWGVGIR